jgi:hypothetical protein
MRSPEPERSRLLRKLRQTIPRIKLPIENQVSGQVETQVQLQIAVTIQQHPLLRIIFPNLTEKKHV